MTFIFNSAQQQFLRDAIAGNHALCNIANMAEVTNMYSAEMMHDILCAIPDSDMRRLVALMMSNAWAKWFRNHCRTNDVGYGYGYDNFRAVMAYLGMSYITQWQPVGPNSMEAYLSEVCNQIDRREVTPWQ